MRIYGLISIPVCWLFMPCDSPVSCFYHWVFLVRMENILLSYDKKKTFSIICLLEGILWLQWTKKWAHFLREELCSNTGWSPRNICLHLVLERVGVRGIPQRTQTVLTLSLLLSYYGIALNTSSIIATKWELVIFNHSESFCEMDIYFYYMLPFLLLTVFGIRRV